MSFILPTTLAGLPSDTPVLLGLSGGADSSALLHMLVRAGVRVSTAHIHHGIRGAEADRDEDFCRALAARCGVPIHVLHADVPAAARERHEGLEEAAREIRYAFFLRVMREHGIPILATAHNADDNLETLLLHIIRGSGTRGGGGIPPVRPLDETGRLVAVRPILTMTKDEILAYCEEHGLSYVTDSTNADVSYARNRLRAAVLPELRRINPDAAGAALRFCDALREDERYFDAQTEALLTGNELCTDELAALPPALGTRVLIRTARRAGAEPDRSHIKAMLDCIAQDCGSVVLPGSVIARVGDGRLTYLRDEREKRARRTEDGYPAPACAPLRDGKNRLPGTSGTLFYAAGEEWTKNSHKIYNSSTSVSLNIDRIKGSLFCRTRRPGDRILCGGMHKSVKKLLCDAHTPLPAALRRALPVVCDGDGIVWVPYLPPRDGCKASLGADGAVQAAQASILFLPDGEGSGTPE